MRNINQKLNFNKPNISRGSGHSHRYKGASFVRTGNEGWTVLWYKYESTDQIHFAFPPILWRNIASSAQARICAVLNLHYFSIWLNSSIDPWAMALAEKSK